MNIENLSINTATFKNLGLDEIINLCLQNKVRALGLWRDKIQEVGLIKTVKMVRDAELHISGLCRAGFFGADKNYNWDNNKGAIYEAATLNADCLVIVAGGILRNKNLTETHKYIQEGLAKMVDLGRELGVSIALEPLHPMYAANRSAINLLKHALTICQEIGEGIGVIIDAYHLWWDPELYIQIKRAGNLNKIYGYHVCDWLNPTKDMLLDRGMMGDGIIDLHSLSKQVLAAGYSGFTEVEIFSTELWKMEPNKLIKLIIKRFSEM